MEGNDEDMSKNESNLLENVAQTSESRKPQIYSHRKGAVPPPPGAVDVSRDSQWGNPFLIGHDGDRDEVCRKFEEYCRNFKRGQPERFALWIAPLRGKDLVCWCRNRPDSTVKCHAQTLIKYANEKQQ